MWMTPSAVDTVSPSANDVTPNCTSTLPGSSAPGFEIVAGVPGRRGNVYLTVAPGWSASVAVTSIVDGLGKNPEAKARKRPTRC